MNIYEYGDWTYIEYDTRNRPERFNTRLTHTPEHFGYLKGHLDNQSLATRYPFYGTVIYIKNGHITFPFQTFS